MTEELMIQNFESRCCLYEKICLYCGIAAVIFLVLAIILFVTLHIPQVFGEFTGRTARRAVRRMTGSKRQRDRPPVTFTAETAALPQEEMETAALPREEIKI
ncbi:MAG TPA: hypothetical protein DF613_02765 [Lachnospiraceae bacterium]|nr:hypothetical protein [Lachnospiraceae bacterium]